MHASQRAAVWFVDVAASFSVEEWDLLEEWRRDLYGKVMRDVHGVLLDLGYRIQNSEILFRITSEGEPCKRALCREGLRPDILLRIKYEEPGALSVKEEEMIKMESGFVPLMKQEKESYDVTIQHSYQHEDDNGFSTPGIVCSAPREVEPPMADTPSSPVPNPVMGSPCMTDMKKEHEDTDPDNMETTGLRPDILLRIKYEEPGALSVKEEEMIKMESGFVPLMKQEKESYDVTIQHSYQHEDDHGFSTPGIVCSAPQEVEPPTADTPSSPVPDPAMGSPCVTDVKKEHEDKHPDNMESTADDASACSLSPNMMRTTSRSPRAEEIREPDTRERLLERKGIARQIKPVAALHNYDQNKQTEPKVNEVPRAFPDCEVNLTDVKHSFPASHPGEGIYPYSLLVKGFSEDASISFQQQGQTIIMCNVCGKTFLHNSSFQIHMRTHTGERPYKCTYCDKSFIYRSLLRIHLRTHTGERPYQCTECEKSFRDNSSFANHQRIHTGEKPYQCSICGKYFRKKSNLKGHYRTHTGERPYKCQHCDKSFHQKSNLRAHQRNHHADSC